MASKRIDEPGFSRRTFLKTVGAGGVAAGVLSPTAAETQSVREVGPDAAPIQLTINGRVHKLEVEPRVTLLDALRTRLEITGVKRVCDRGACGACTVIVDGRTVYACSTLAIEAQGKAIRTVESFTQGTVLHPVQQAFCDHDGLMCGFCTPGFVVSAVALLERNPKPTREQARKALDGNICRCGTYQRVLEAVLDPRAAGQRRAEAVGPSGQERAPAASPRREVTEGERAGVGPREQLKAPAASPRRAVAEGERAGVGPREQLKEVRRG